MRLRILDVRSDRSARRALCECYMCGRTFRVTVRQLRARFERWGIFKCPGCGAVHERPARMPA